jgi:uncharacterized protein YpmS
MPGRVVVIGVLALVVIGGALVWRAVSTPTSTPHVAISHASAVRAQGKLQAISQAASQASHAGQTVRVIESFTDSELSSLANQEAQSKGLPFRNLVLHATAARTVQGGGLVRLAGQELPLSLEVVPTVAADRVHFQVTSIHVGTLPLPGPVTDQDLGQPPAGFHDLHVMVKEGQLTISGTAGP